MGNQQTVQPTTGLIKIPQTYPKSPTPGKIQALWNANSTALYHRLSPYNGTSNTLIPGFTKEPYYWVYPDEGNKGLNALRKYDTRAYPIASAPIDVIRVSKFLGSGNGIIFVAKQLLLQTGNAFNETRVYNPASPIIAAGMGLGAGTIRPQRNFDTSAGLMGVASTLIGGTIPNAIFGAPKINPPGGTIGSALPIINASTDGKGLSRAQTANTGLSMLKSKWGDKTAGPGFIKQLFANIGATSQDSNIQYKSSEGAYGIMLKAGPSRFTYIGNSGDIGFIQKWIAGSKGIRKQGEINESAARISRSPDGTIPSITPAKTSLIGNPAFIPGVGNTGFSIGESSDSLKPGIRYGDSVGVNKSKYYEASEIMMDYSAYVQPGSKYPSKNPNLAKTNASLQAAIKAIASDTYKVVSNSDSVLLPTGDNSDPNVNGYNRLFKVRTSNPTLCKDYPGGVMKDYKDKNIRMIDNSVAENNDLSIGFSTSKTVDNINILEVIPKEIKDDIQLWDPYHDDLIAFYFYDVVNKQYIPFRATIKGLSEAGNSSWEEMSFIGRGDKVYSYGGFTRNLSFTFKIVIGSIAELIPTWQRINYLTTLIKPSNYTTAVNNSVMNRMMVPPMVILTVGDMYKDQPILIQTITTTIPDDASWETLNANNSTQWDYLARFINAPGILYGQLPREIDISINAFLLEKERAIVGGANFGHAPRNDDWSDWNKNTEPNGRYPDLMNKQLIVGNGKFPSVGGSGVPPSTPYKQRGTIEATFPGIPE